MRHLREITGAVVDSAILVHRELGPGLLESAYEACLVYDLRDRGLEVKRQVAQPVRFRGITLDIGYRLDLVVESRAVVEVKCVAKLLPVHEAQLLSYLRLGDYSVGLLLNFRTALMKEGIRRLLNGYVA